MQMEPLDSQQAVVPQGAYVYETWSCHPLEAH